MKKIILTTALCLSLSACETASNLEWPSLNPFGNDEVTEVVMDDSPQMPAAPVATVNQSALQTELDEMEKLTGNRLQTQSLSPAPEPETLAEQVDDRIDDIKPEIEPVLNEPILEEETAEILEPEVKQPEPRPVETPKMAEPIAVTKPKAEPVTISNDTPLQLSSADGCPKIEIMPSARSITYFEDNMSGQMIARASISEIRGGCEVVRGGIELDLDILMRGTITNKGRFEGNVNEEAFMTFPYFVSVFTPQGLPVNKDILATAMRFRPSVDFTDHAEKITQFIPIDNVTQASNYKIVVGYQLTRQQLEYNRIESAARPDNKRVSPDTSPVRRRSVNPLAE